MKIFFLFSDIDANSISKGVSSLVLFAALISCKLFTLFSTYILACSIIVYIYFLHFFFPFILFLVISGATVT